MRFSIHKYVKEQVGPQECHSVCYSCVRSLEKSCKGEEKPCDNYRHGDTEFRNLLQVCEECEEVFHYKLFRFRERRLCYTCYLSGYEREDEINPYGTCSVTEQVGYNLDNIRGSSALLTKETFSSMVQSSNTVSFLSGE